MTPPKVITIELEVLKKDQAESGHRSRSVARIFDIEEIMYIMPGVQKNRACIYTKTDVFTTYDNYKTIVGKLCALGKTQIQDNCITIVPCMFYVIGKKHIVQGASIDNVLMDEKGANKLLLKRDDWKAEITLHTAEEKADARKAWAASCVAACLAQRDRFAAYGEAFEQRCRQSDATQKQLDTMVEQMQQLMEENKLLRQRVEQLEAEQQKV